MELRATTASKIRRDFRDADALAHDLRRKLRFSQLDPILGLDLSDVDVGADLERQLDRHVPVVGAGGIVVEQIIDAGSWTSIGRATESATISALAPG